MLGSLSIFEQKNPKSPSKQSQQKEPVNEVIPSKPSQPGTEPNTIIDDNIRFLFKELESLPMDSSTSIQEEKFSSLIQALNRNCAKPEVQARYLAYDAAKKTDFQKVQQCPPYPIESDGFARSFDPLLNEQDFWNCWTTYGFIVSKSVISENLCVKTIARIHKICEQLSEGKFSINDASTHDSIPKDKEGNPLISRGFMEVYHDACLAELRQALRIYIHHVIIWGRTDLWTTYDRLGVKLAGHKESHGLPLHVDQNPTVQPAFETVQGVLALTECPVEQGTFMAVPASLNAFDEYTRCVEAHEKAPYRGEYVELKNHPELQTLMEEKKQPIPLHAGDQVSWDSRTTHANTANLKGTARIVAYISAGPACNNDQNLVQARRDRFFDGAGINLRAAKQHASMKPRFTDPQSLAQIREPEELNPLGKCLYGEEPYTKFTP